MSTAGQQSTVNTQQPKAFAGMRGDGSHCRSKVSEEASAEIPFGVMLARGTSDPENGALLPHTSAAAMASAFIGVAAHSHAYAKPDELGDTGLKPKVTLGVHTQGPIWVVPEEAVVAHTSAVRVRVLAGGGEQAGEFRATADASDCVDISAFAHWETSAGAGEPALLWVDMTSPAGTAD